MKLFFVLINISDFGVLSIFIVLGVAKRCRHLRSSSSIHSLASLSPDGMLSSIWVESPTFDVIPMDISTDAPTSFKVEEGHRFDFPGDCLRLLLIGKFLGTVSPSISRYEVLEMIPLVARIQLLLHPIADATTNVVLVLSQLVVIHLGKHRK
jgi:hypothetical protein